MDGMTAVLPALQVMGGRSCMRVVAALMVVLDLIEQQAWVMTVAHRPRASDVGWSTPAAVVATTAATIQRLASC
jgi:hypothetical protein